MKVLFLDIDGVLTQKPLRPAYLSPELLQKAERAAKFFQQLPPDDDAGNDPDYGL